MERQYNYRNCQSLFGYAMLAHKRSGGICQYCECNSGAAVSFDLWRQMTVEHIIGSKRGGYRKMIAKAIAERFPELLSTERDRLVQRLDQANTVTACGFCNSLTSQYEKHGRKIAEMFLESNGTPDEIVDRVILEIGKLFEAKRANVRQKIAAVREAFEKFVEPDLRQFRCAGNKTI